MLPKQLRFLHPYFHLIGLLLMIVGLPFSKLLMSLSQFFVGINWILEGNFKDKWQRLKRNKKAWMLMGIFLMLLPGMLYTQNLDAGLKMIRINLPLLIFPLVLGSRDPLPKVWYESILKLSIFLVWLATLACTIWGLPHWLNAELTDIRKISIFISHIRFALIISFSVLLCFWMLVYKPFIISKIQRFLLLGMMLWMIVFLFILQSLTGIFILTGILFAWAIFLVMRKLSRLKIALIFGLITSSSAFLIYQTHLAYVDYFTPEEIYSQPLPKTTALGNGYSHNLSVIENGHYVFSFLSQDELIEAWKKRSNRDIDSADGKGQLTYATLIRFLNSKGLPKDASGVNALSEKEINYIEKGIANVNYTGLWGIKMRFYQLLWEVDYLKRGSTEGTGHTLVMKLEFLKNAVLIIKENPWIGVGIGDVKNVFIEHYKKVNSWLAPHWRMTCHNQYLYIGVATGVPGMLLFLFIFFRPVTLDPYLPLIIFFIIAAISMISEDTLTTQEGVSFVAFFYSFFLFCRPLRKSSIEEDSSSS
ncbi:MAG: O-antigen ligase family protein [Bacteroidia bacterium]